LSSEDTAAIKPLPQLLDTEVSAPGEDELVDRLRDEQLAGLKDNLGFQQITEILQVKIDGYRRGLGIKADTNTDYAEIGKRYLVSSLVAEELEGVLAQIDAAVNAIKEDEEE
jgi:hypothetical protein